jgi:hypothetical protein
MYLSWNEAIASSVIHQSAMEQKVNDLNEGVTLETHNELTHSKFDQWQKTLS